MYKQSINFTTQPLVIKTKKKLTHELLLEISRFIQFVKYDFNMDIHNSSAYLFNASPINAPTLTNKEFIYYLKKNIESAEVSDNAFNPFYSRTILDRQIILNDEIKIEDETIVKKSPIYFKTKPLMEAFVVDTVYDILVRNEIRGFLIETRHFFRASDEDSWDIKYDIEDENFYLSKIKGGTVYFHYVDDIERTFVEGHNIDSAIYLDARIIVMEAVDAMNARVITEIVKDLYTKKQFEDFAFKNRVKLVVYDKSNNSHVFNYR